MANDVQKISATSAKVAARLCNFVTGKSFLLLSHQDFLDGEVQSVIRGMVGPWVDLFGYASHLGKPGSNQTLSEQRIESVRRRISEYANVINFQISTGFGESQSTGDENDDNGYWRAVEVYVYATKPPSPKPEAIDDGLSSEFGIRVLSGTSVGKGAQADAYDFEIIDRKRRKAATFRYQGVGMPLPGPPNVPISHTRSGPVKHFNTTRGVELPDFEGSAQLFQDPGVTIGGFSKGGTLRLSIESTQLLVKGARLIPTQIIPIDGGSGFQTPSMGSATTGRIFLRGEIRRHLGPF